MSREEFQHYWLEKHGPLVRKHAATLHIRRYVQVHRHETGANDLLAAQRGCQPSFYDGVAELWWDSLEDMAAVMSDPAAQVAGQELLEDEARFIDLANSPLWLGEEHEVVGA
jgi:uncharacterized protein (TIGR02118 family)